MLAEVLAASEPELVRCKGFGRPRQEHLMINELLLHSGFLETRRDRRLNTLWAEVLFEIKSLRVVFLKLEKILLS